MQITMPSAEKILATADAALCKNQPLQVAHDLVLLLPEDASFDENGVPTTAYVQLWEDYKRAGGSRSMLEPDIDNNNWQRFLGR